jgi:hypothetical protein
MFSAPLLAAVTLSLGDTTDASLRTVPIGDRIAMDVYNVPFSRLALRMRHSQLELSYSPAFQVFDASYDPRLLVLHTAEVDYAWWTRRLQLKLGVTGTIGRQSFLGPAPANAPLSSPGVGIDPGGVVQPAPAAPGGTPTNGQVVFRNRREVLEIGSLTPQLSATYLLSRRWSMSAGVSYVLAGGLGDSEQVLPLRRGPVGVFGLTYELSKRDLLVSSLTASLVEVPSRGSRYYTATFLETYSHRFARLTVGTIGAGASYLQSRDTPTAKRQRSLLAAGTVSITHGVGLDRNNMLSFGAGSSLGTTYNPLLGTVNQTLSEFVLAKWSRPRVSIQLNGDANQTLPPDDPNAVKFFGAGVINTYQVAEPVQLVLGGRWVYQVLPERLTNQIRPSSWLLFANLVLALEPIQF